MIWFITDLHNAHEYGSEGPRALSIIENDEVFQTNPSPFSGCVPSKSVPHASPSMWWWVLCLVYFNLSHLLPSGSRAQMSGPSIKPSYHTYLCSICFSLLGLQSTIDCVA